MTILRIAFILIGALLIVCCVLRLRSEREKRAAACREALAGAYLEIREPGCDVRAVPLTCSEVTLGRRARRADIPLHSLTVSRAAARLLLRNGAWYIYPLSRRGRYSELTISSLDLPVGPEGAMLKPGTRVRLGCRKDGGVWLRLYEGRLPSE